jgi:hypothetical protein
MADSGAAVGRGGAFRARAAGLGLSLLLSGAAWLGPALRPSPSGDAPLAHGAAAVSIARAETVQARRDRARPLPESPDGPRRREHGPICQKRLTARQTRGAEGCFTDERVTQGPGLLSFPCEGDGTAKAQFRTATFVGTLRAGQLDLVLSTRFPYADGCEWETVQRVRGALSSPTLDYTYTESPRAGQTGCAGACRATAEVRVSDVGATR